MTGSVLQLNISPGGIPKRPIPEAIVTVEGVRGDHWAHPDIHGGPKSGPAPYYLRRNRRAHRPRLPALSRRAGRKPHHPGARSPSISRGPTVSRRRSFSRTHQAPRSVYSAQCLRSRNSARYLRPASAGGRSFQPALGSQWLLRTRPQRRGIRPHDPIGCWIEQSALSPACNPDG